MRRIHLLTALPFLVLSIRLDAQDCSQILKYGIFDEYSVLDIQTSYEIVKSSICKDEGGKLSIDGFGSLEGSRDVCKTSFLEARKSYYFSETIKTASQTIADAWVRCIETTMTDNNFYHYVRTTQNPRAFIYNVVYKGATNDASIIESVAVTGLDAENTAKLKSLEGESVNRSGKVLEFYRNPSCPVSIAITVSRGSGNHLETINIPSYPGLRVVELREQEEPPSDMIQVIGFQADPTEDPDEVSGYFPNLYNDISTVQYGKWDNSHCGLSGEGWHMTRLGSCGTGKGSGSKRAYKVWVLVSGEEEISKCEY